MREILLRARKAPTSSKFSLDTLPESGHLEIVCACVTNALWVAGALRQDTLLHVSCEGPPIPPLLFTFDGTKINFHYSERNVAIAIKEALLDFEKKKEPLNGISIQKKSFEQFVKEKSKTIQSFYLHPKGIDVRKVNFKEDVFIVLGDHKGIPQKSEKFLKRLPFEKISVSPHMLFASQCVTLLQNELDRQRRL